MSDADANNATDTSIDKADQSEKLKCLTPEEVLEIIEQAQKIVIAGHVNPDGDALGSALALRDLLKSKGKDVVVLLGQDHEAPELYEFLPEYDFVYGSEYVETPDLFITVDASTAKRLGTSERVLKASLDSLVIDHHTNYEGFANHYWGDSSAPATATLIWELIKTSDVAPTLQMATYCYIGIMTDTGRFAFKNTNRSALVDASEMVALGVDPARMSERVYENKSLPSLRLEALIIDRAQFSCNGSIAYSYIEQNDLDSLGIERDETEGLPTILRSIKGVQVAVLFREEGHEGVRVNLRSRHSYNVGALASEFGGGGHAGAAGLTLEMPLEEAISCIVGKLVKEVPACH